jgi:hypothetical protein
MFPPVRLAAAPDIAEWLARRPRMEWDAGNSTKSQSKHASSRGAATGCDRSAAVRCGRGRRRPTMQRRKTTARGGTMKNTRSARDATLREFEKQDLGKDIASAGTAVVVRPQRPTSILLSDELKAALRKRGQELGVGYQTAAKMILARYVNAKL